VAWHAATWTMVGVGDLVQRTGDGRTGWVLGGRVASCAVCTWHVETRSAGFMVEPQNQGRRFVSGLASKPLRRFSPVWPQNRWRWFLAVWPQNCCDGFCSKPVATVSPGLDSKPVVGFLVEPQNQVGGGFPGLGLKIGSFSLVILVLKPP
jgi:hypothetical protein